MKMTSYALVAILAAVSLAGGAAIAKGMGHGPMGARMDAAGFAKIDADKDGEVTMEEMQAHRAARFDAADTNGDGMLSVDEMAARMRDQADYRAARMVERMDSDGDGMLAADEMRRHGGRKGKSQGKDHAKRAERFFDRADADNSGGLSLAEVEAMQDHMSKRMGKRRHGDLD